MKLKHFMLALVAMLSGFAFTANAQVAKVNGIEYQTLSAAFAAVTDDAQTVFILEDVTEELTGAYLRGNIITENDAKVTITLTNEDWVYCPYTFVIGGNVTLKVPALFYYAGGAQINGTVNADAYYQRYVGTKLTINEPGSMTVTTEMFYLRYTDNDANAGIYINGDNNDETIGLNLAVAYFYQGMINAKNANIKVGTYWQTNETDGQGSANLVLDNSTLNVTVNEHDFKATGNSTVTLKNNSAITVAGGFVTGDNTVLSGDATSLIKDKNGEVALPVVVAKIGEQSYETLEAAFAAATEGQTITMLNDATPALTSQRAITKAAVIDLGGKTMTLTEDDLYFGTTTFKNGTIVVDPSVKPSTAVFWMFANQTLTFDKVKIVATGVTGTYLIGLDGNNSDLNLLNGSEILVENTTALDLDIICVNASTGNDIKVENSKVNVTNLDGRVFFRGNYTVKDSEVNLAGITKAGFRIEAGQTLSIEGTSQVNISGEPRDGGIHMTDLSATYTKAETATVNATVNRPAVAKIGDTPYYSLSEAAAAAQAGSEIKLLADATVEGTLALPAGIKLTSNGHTINGSIRMLGDLELNGALTITGGLWVGKSGETLTATLSGDKLTASYFMFQRGTYTINADIDAVYGYLSYEGTFEVNSIIHTTGANGEVLYINGNVTLNDGAVLDSDNSVFVCNDNAVLTLKPGSKVDSNVSITKSGAKLNIDATGMAAGATANITGTVTNSGNGTIAVINNDKLEAKIVDGKIVLAAKPVAKIGDTPYYSLSEAVAAAQAGETITLLADIEATEVILLGKSLTINGNGHKVTSNATRVFRVTVKDTEVTLNDVKMVSNTAVNYPNDVRGISIDDVTGVQLTLNYCSVDFTHESAHDWSYAVNVVGGSGHVVTVNGGTYEGANVINVRGANQTVSVKGATLTSLYKENSNTENYGACIYVKQNAESSVFAEGNTFNGNNAMAINAGSTPVTESSNTDNTKLFITGEGTEANPYLITHASQFVDFRNSVNAGETKYNAEGVYVALGANIDLAGQDWSVNIGDDAGMTFDGIFDGKGFTISNLTSTETAKKGDGYICTGLFGAIAGKAVVRNFTIENVTIDAQYVGNNVAAVVGWAYNCTGSIENVTVTGNININAPNTTGVGAILGYDYYSPTLKVENCEVIGSESSSIVGAAYVGGVVGYASNKIAMNDNTVENLSITATSAAAGGVAGIMLAGGSAANNTVKNVDLASNHVNWNNAVGVVVGTITTGKVTIANTTIDNVNTDAVAGAIHANKPITPVTKVEACIDNDYYTTFEGAYQAAQEGATITLLAPVVIADGETLTLDKNVAINNTAKFDGALSISAGTYDADVTEFCAEGFICQDNGNGTYGVIADPNYIEELTLVDGQFTEYTYTAETKVGTFTYTRTFRNANVWNAIYLPFEIPVDMLVGNYDVAYINDVHSADENGDGEIAVSEMKMEVIKITNDAAILKANHPYLIRAKSDEAKVWTITLTDAILYPAVEETYECSSMYTTYSVTGTCRTRTKDELANSLVMSVNGAWVTSTTGMNPFRLCLTMTDRNGSPVKVQVDEQQAMRIRVRGEEDATGLESIELEQGTVFIYDLQGRRVLEPQKGNLYIVNGKKVIF